MSDDEIDFLYSPNRKHSYGQYISDIDWAERILSENEDREQDLIDDLTRFLNQERGIMNSSSKKRAKWKAFELVEGYKREIPQEVMDMKPVIKDKSKSKRRFILKKIVREAGEKGYMLDFRLSEPWHIEPFMEGEINTFPYQHNSIIVYRGISRDNYYLEEKKPEKKDGSKRNPISIFNQGYLNPGNSFNGDNDDGVWTSPFLDVTKGYASRKVEGKTGVVLEMQIPTRWAQFGAHDTRVVNNLNEMVQEYKKPENFREHLQQRADENASVIVRPRVPLKFVTGVWDTEYSEDPIFVPLQSDETVDAADLAYKVSENKVPENPKHAEVRDIDKLEDFLEIKKVRNEIERFHESSKDLMNRLKALEEANEQTDNFDYNEHIRGLIKPLKLNKEVNDTKFRKSLHVNGRLRRLIQMSREAGINLDIGKQKASNLRDYRMMLAQNTKDSQGILEDFDRKVRNLEPGELEELDRDILRKLNDLTYIVLDEDGFRESLGERWFKIREEVREQLEVLEHLIELIEDIEKYKNALNQLERFIEQNPNIENSELREFIRENFREGNRWLIEDVDLHIHHGYSHYYNWDDENSLDTSFHPEDIEVTSVSELQQFIQKVVTLLNEHKATFERLHQLGLKEEQRIEAIIPKLNKESALTYEEAKEEVQRTHTEVKKVLSSEKEVMDKTASSLRYIKPKL